MAARVLVVDDEVDFLRSIVERLTLRNMGAHGVSSGAEALRFLADHEVDVVLLDMKMPGMDGIETLREIRRLQPDLAVIVITGHASPELSDRGRDLGVFDYLIKPVRLNKVVDRILEACGLTPG